MSAPIRSAPLEPAPGRTAEALVEIVVEGGFRVGFGHAGRCLALWEELGGRAVFRMQDVAVGRFLKERGAPVVGAGGAPVVVLDRAVPAAVAEVRALHAEGRRAVLIDDLGPARLLADAVVDPPTAARWPAAAGLRLAGFEHVLLRREVREAGAARSGLVERAGAAVAARVESAGAAVAPCVEPAGVLLAMGGSDPAGVTPLLARVLAGAGIEARVALGPGYRGLSPIEGAVLFSPGEFVPALAASELLIAGYGHSLLEAAHLGVPAIAVVVKPEHLPHARAFCAKGTALLFDLTERSGAGRLGGMAAGVSGEAGRLGGMAAGVSGEAGRLGEMAAGLLDDRGLRGEMSARAAALVDGLGSRRVARVLMELA